MTATLTRPENSTEETEHGGSDKVSLKTWIAVLGTLLGCFMAVLDIIVTNASLREIAGTLAASQDEISWVPTAYLVAEIVVIPLTAWLSSVFSLRNYLIVNSILFIIFSVCCGQAHSLPMMILFRALQGFTGGVLIPLSFTVILTYLPPSKHPVGLALFSVTAVFAPAVGPLIGGWLTENYGWPYIFYLNVVPGLLLVAASWYALKREKMDISGLWRGDWWGILTMAIGLAAFEVVLDDGNRKDWFGDPTIVKLAWIAAIFLTAFVIIELRSKDPLVELRLFGRRNFALGSVVNVALGCGLYGFVYILPFYLSAVQGYNSLEIGKTIIWMGVPQLLVIPLIPRLMSRIDPRIIIFIGILLFGGSTLLTIHLDANFSGLQFHIPLIIRALGQPMIMVPISAIATEGMAPGRESGAASALFNMMRNIGGSVGIAALSTIVSVRERFHSFRIGESVSLYSPATQARLAQTTGYFTSQSSEGGSSMRSIIALGRIVKGQATIMAFSDTLLVLSCVLLSSMVALLFMKKPHVKGGGAAH
jgi:MFS transporter, DHA2 family, multidrug resistance protein